MKRIVNSMSHRSNQAGFTLLELIVVVAILALIGGGALVAYDSLQSKAAKSAATHSIAAVDAAIRNFTAVEGNSPSEFDSLVAGTYDASSPGSPPNGALDYAGNLGSKLQGKFAATPFVLDSIGINTLNTAGITTLRYIDANGNGNQDQFDARIAVNLTGPVTLNDLDGDGAPETFTGSLTIARRDPISNDGASPNMAGSITFTDPVNAPANISQLEVMDAANLPRDTYVRAIDTAVALDVPAADGSAAFVRSLANIDIPNRIFDTPREGAASSARNRGRGWRASVSGASVPVALWKAGAGGINNVKVGGLEDDVLIALGVGNNCSMIGQKGQVRSATLAQAPFYSDVAKNEYSRYIALYKIGTNIGNNDDPTDATEVSFAGEAVLVAVVDPRGDFLDEEFAEGTGQKQ